MTTDAPATEPHFVPVDLTELQDAGVLMAANARFFWPLGLALTWDHDKDTGQASGLHIRQWEYPDGHHESIGLEPGDQIAEARRTRFEQWVSERIRSLPPDEQHNALLAAAGPNIVTPIADQ